MRLWLAGLAIVATMGGALAQTDLPRVVAERREGLKAVGAHFEAIGGVARSGGDPTAVVDRIAAVQAFFVNFGARFPEGTQQGAPGIDTKALPAIWTDRPGFDRALAELMPRLVTLREAAASGNVANFQAAAQQAGAGCGGCHRPYRAR
ncbi:MAG: hypothetical protein JWR10_448 [Rubritepida sp.]|nr:hypothetical protein [Rubritepida sp.]